MSLGLEHHLRHVPIYCAEDVEAIVYKESVFYRQRVAVVIHFCRLMAVAVFLFVLLPMQRGDVLFAKTSTDVPLSIVVSVLIAILYFLWLAMMLLLSRRERLYQRLLLPGAVVDAAILLMFALLLEIFNVFNPGPLLFVVSVMSSVLTLNSRQSIIFGLICALMVSLAIGAHGGHEQFDIMSTNPSLREMFFNVDVFAYLSRLGVGELAQVLLQGAIFGCAIAMLGYFSAKAQENKMHARLNRYFARNLSRLNESVIEEMGSGLIVVNTHGVIVTLNRRAREMLTADGSAMPSLPLSMYSQALNKRFQTWLRLRVVEHQSLQLATGRYSLGFVALDKGPDPDMSLIMLENEEVHYERVRETRLASLGRLSAGIAHEIRNPLSAIQQASELLAELQGQDALLARLNEKIGRNARRINSIVSEVMRLFDGQAQHASHFLLNAHLCRIVTEAREYSELKTVDIGVALNETEACVVLFSPDAMREVILNLLLNARKHNPDVALSVRITTRLSEDKCNVYLDIADDGCGIEVGDEEKIFEPFYSRRNSTGLGLYLVREMCNANHARIIYLRRNQGACFRIIMRAYDNTVLDGAAAGEAQ